MEERIPAMRQYGKYQKYISLILMIVLSFGGQIISLAKNTMVAGVFGTSEEMDAYNFANSVTTFLFSFVSSAVPTIVLPSYIKKQDGSQAINCFITTIYGILFVFAILLLAFRFTIVSVLTTRGSTYAYMVCSILLIMIFAQYINSWTYVTLAFFHSKGQYNIPKVINLFSQTVVLIVLAVYQKLTIVQYTQIVAFGIIFGAIIDIHLAVKKGWRYSPALSWENKETKSYLKAFLPIVFSTGVYQLSLMTDSLLTERLEQGMITILAYSSQISAIVNTVVIGNLKTYVYPRIVRNIKEGKPQELFWKQSEALYCIVWLIIAGFIVVGRDGVSLLFEHGAFNAKAANSVYVGAAIYIVGQQFNVIRDMVYKYFYGKGDTKTPASNSVLVSISNIVISLVLQSIFGFYGVIAGTVCASLLSLCVILIRFAKRIGFERPLTEVLCAYLKTAIIGITTIITVMCIKMYVTIESDVLVILVFGMSTIVVYALLQLVFNRKIAEAFRML